MNSYDTFIDFDFSSLPTLELELQYYIKELTADIPHTFEDLLEYYDTCILDLIALEHDLDNGDPIAIAFEHFVTYLQSLILKQQQRVGPGIDEFMKYCSITFGFLSSSSPAVNDPPAINGGPTDQCRRACSDSDLDAAFEVFYNEMVETSDKTIKELLEKPRVKEFLVLFDAEDKDITKDVFILNDHLKRTGLTGEPIPQWIIDVVENYDYGFLMNIVRNYEFVTNVDWPLAHKIVAILQHFGPRARTMGVDAKIAIASATSVILLEDQVKRCDFIRSAQLRLHHLQRYSSAFKVLLRKPLRRRCKIISSGVLTQNIFRPNEVLDAWRSAGIGLAHPPRFKKEH